LGNCESTSSSVLLTVMEDHSGGCASCQLEKEAELANAELIKTSEGILREYEFYGQQKGTPPTATNDLDLSSTLY